ncbi:MAG: hypothetical protein ACREN7_00165 [Candidatus Dormibacteria bacterium]
MPPPPDPNSPISVAQARGLPRSVQMTDPDGKADPLQMADQMRQRQQMEEMQRMRMSQLQSEQTREQARLRAETSQADLQTLEADAKRVELQERLEEFRRARAGGGDGAPSLTDRLLDQMLQEAQTARQDAQALREQTQQELRGELARMRDEMSRQIAHPTEERPIDALAQNLTQLKDLRELFRATDPTPSWSGPAGDVNLTIKQMEMQQDFELRREQMQMEREERNRKWEEAKSQRDEERALRLAELNQRRERDHMLGTALNDVMPRIGDAFGGMRPAPAQGGGEAGPPGGTETIYCTRDGCGAPIVVGPHDTQVICPNCKYVYAIGRN